MDYKYSVTVRVSPTWDHDMVAFGMKKRFARQMSMAAYGKAMIAAETLCMTDSSHEAVVELRSLANLYEQLVAMESDDRQKVSEDLSIIFWRETK